VDIVRFVETAGGIVHRQTVLDAGARPAQLRAAIAAHAVERVRRYWVATPTAPPPLVAAAHATARLACISAARHRGWWVPPDATTTLHLHVRAGARPPGVDGTVHWSRPLVPVSAHLLVESIVDSLEHLADCLPREQAVVLLESAVRCHGIPPEELARVQWRSGAAR
jgi:hypothetical protein